VADVLVLILVLSFFAMCVALVRGATASSAELNLALDQMSRDEN
jgi:hypothetical protein